jgi:hypothetical protein
MIVIVEDKVTTGKFVQGVFVKDPSTSHIEYYTVDSALDLLIRLRDEVIELKKKIQ